MTSLCNVHRVAVEYQVAVDHRVVVDYESTLVVAQLLAALIEIAALQSCKHS